MGNFLNLPSIAVRNLQVMVETFAMFSLNVLFYLKVFCYSNNTVRV